MQDFAKELDDNNIQVLIEEADKIDGIEPELKDELNGLDDRWDKIHDATKDKNVFYDDLMTKWAAFRDQQLTLLNWIDEKDADVAGGKDQVNLADEDDVAEHIKKLKVRERICLFVLIILRVLQARVSEQGAVILVSIFWVFFVMSTISA